MEMAVKIYILLALLAVVALWAGILYTVIVLEGGRKWLERLAHHRTRWYRYHSVYSELSRMTERELKDIGLSRGDIERAAREELDR